MMHSASEEIKKSSSSLRVYWQLLTGKSGFSVWHIILLIETMTILHGIYRAVWYFLEEVPYSKVMVILVPIFFLSEVVWGIVKIFLLLKGLKHRNAKFLRAYTLVQQIVVLPIVFPVMYWALYIYWRNSTVYTTLLPLTIVLVVFTPILFWLVYWEVPKKVLNFQTELMAVQQLQEYVANLGASEFNMDPEVIKDCQRALTRKSFQDQMIGRISETEKQKIKDDLILSWSITFDKEGKIGEGHFGYVHKGVLVKNGKRIDVVAKICKQSEGEGRLRRIWEELRIFLHVGDHENIVKYIGLGCCPLLGNYFLVMEYCAKRNLRDYLHYFRENNTEYLYVQDPLSKGNNNSNAGRRTRTFSVAKRFKSHGNIWDPVLQSFNSLLNELAIGIAKGMAFLASKNVVHGDLTARNVLLTETLVPKLTDFGLAGKLQQQEAYIRFPDQEVLHWRWMSPEVLTDLKFSEKSDMWSFGVTMWELYSLGETPFARHIWASNVVEQSLSKIEMILTRPNVCDKLWYGIMKQCWNKDPKKRPKFEDILQLVKMNKDSKV